MIGKKFRHYEGGIYELMAIAHHYETHQTMAVLRDVATLLSVVCPYLDFLEVVEHNGKLVQRFAQINPADVTIQGSRESDLVHLVQYLIAYSTDFAKVRESAMSLPAEECKRYLQAEASIMQAQGDELAEIGKRPTDMAAVARAIAFVAKAVPME